MNTEYIRDDVLMAHFLEGRLDAGDREEFLARFLADADALERLRRFLHDRQVPERFLADALSAEEQDAYEALCMAEPDLFSDLDALERSQQAYRDLARSAEFSTPAAVAGRRRWPALFESPQFAAAASVLLLVSLVTSGLLYRDNLSLRGQGGGGWTTTQLAPLQVFRSADPNVVTQPAIGEVQLFSVDVSDTYDDHRVTLVSEASPGEPIFEQSGLEPVYQMLVFGVAGELLVPGDYQIIVEGRGEGAYERITAVPLRIEATQ